MARRLVARRDGRERRAVRPPGPRVERRRAGRAVPAAEQVGAQRRRPASVSSAWPGPMSGSHQSPAASAEPVRAWTTRTCGASVRRRPVVAVGDDQLGQGGAAFERERAERRGLEPPCRSAVGRLGRPVGAVRVASRHPARADRHPVGRRCRRVAAASAWSRSAMRSSTCSRPTDSRTRSGRDAGRRSAPRAELRVGGRGRMDDQRLRVADVGQQAEDLDASMSRAPASAPPLTPNVTMPPKPPLEVLLGERVRRVRGEARVADPGDLRAGLQPLGDGQRVLAVALDAQRQRLEALEEQERVERAESAAPMSRRPWTRSLRMNARLPKASV